MFSKKIKLWGVKTPPHPSQTAWDELSIQFGSTNPVSTLSSSAASSKKPKSLSTGLQQKFFLLFARPGDKDIANEDKLTERIVQAGQSREIHIINESGLYSLLFSMQPQKAHNDGASDAYPIETQQRIEN